MTSMSEFLDKHGEVQKYKGKWLKIMKNICLKQEIQWIGLTTEWR